MKRVCLAFAFTLLFRALLPAQEQQEISRLGVSDLTFSGDTVEMSVISASRSSKKVGELPITIYVVTRDEIVRNHYYTLIDVIRNLPGVRVSQPGSGELAESFQLRGLTGNLYTMILINGLPVKPTAVIGMPILAQLPVRQAERIEIIYGPAAAIYGADALSGVINIITREAEKGTFVLGDVSIGQNDFRNTDFIVGGKAGKNKNILQYSFYGSHNQTSDMNIWKGYEDVYNPLNFQQERGVKYTIGSTEYDPVDLTEEILVNEGIDPDQFIAENYMQNYEGSLELPDAEDLPAESSLLGFNLRYRGLSIAFNNMYRRSHSSLGQSSWLYKYNNPQTWWGENIRSVSFSYNGELSSRLFTTTNISDLTYRMDNNSSMGVTFTGYTDKVYRYSASHDFLIEQILTAVPTNNLEIISGITFRNSSILPQTNFLDVPFNTKDYSFATDKVSFSDPVYGQFGFNPQTEINFSAFSQAYYSLSRLRFMGGLRFDNNSEYGFSFSPRIAGLYIVNPKTSIRSSVGFAYKAPPSSMAWQSLAYKDGADYDSLRYIFIPNPGLDPEKYMSVELGFIKRYKERFSMNISLYYNTIRNLIVDRRLYLNDLDLPLAIIDTDTSSVMSKANNTEAVSNLYGIQATFRFNDLIRSIHMDAEVNLNFARSSEKVPDIFELAGDFVSNFKLTPNHFGQLKISMRPAKRLYLQVSSIWESSWLRVLIPVKEIYDEFINDVDGFYSMDVVADYSIGSNLKSFIRVSNLFDEKYGGPVWSGMNTPLPYSPQTGRTIQVGLTYTLN